MMWSTMRTLMWSAYSKTIWSLMMWASSSSDGIQRRNANLGCQKWFHSMKPTQRYFLITWTCQKTSSCSRTSNENKFSGTQGNNKSWTLKNRKPRRKLSLRIMEVYTTLQVHSSMNLRTIKCSHLSFTRRWKTCLSYQNRAIVFIKLWTWLTVILVLGQGKRNL